MQLEILVSARLYQRWVKYQKANPAWTLDGLLAQLLTQHLNDADDMAKSIEEQEKKRRHE